MVISKTTNSTATINNSDFNSKTTKAIIYTSSTLNKVLTFTLESSINSTSSIAFNFNSLPLHSNKSNSISLTTDSSLAPI